MNYNEVKPTDSNAVLPIAKTAKYQSDDMSFTLAENIGATLLDLNLGTGSLLWSPITDGGYTGKLGSAGSVGSASVWPAGRFHGEKQLCRLHTKTGLIDLRTEKQNGEIPSKDGLAMHGLGFTSPNWEVTGVLQKKDDDGFMVVNKYLDFSNEKHPSLAKFGATGQLNYTHRIGKNESGNNVFRTSINANTTDPNTVAYLSSLAEHYFFKGDANTVVSSQLKNMHNSYEDEGFPELHKPGFTHVKGTKYDLSKGDGVKIIGDNHRREAILEDWSTQTIDGEPKLQEVARIKQADHTLVIRQKATLGGKHFPNGILVFADPSMMKDRFCIEPYFGFINGQNREFANESHVQALTVGKGHGEFNAEIEIELIPNK